MSYAATPGQIEENTDDTIVRRFADATERRGRLILLRRVGAPGAGGPSPPSVVDPVISGSYAPGAFAVSIRATSATGRLVAGDQLVMGSLPPLLIRDMIASTPAPIDPSAVWQPGFLNVPLGRVLPAPIADGTPVSFWWSTDQAVYATVRDFALTLRSDAITAGDLDVTIAAYGVARPTTSDQLLIDGQMRSIVSVRTIYQRQLVVAWQVQAR